MKKERFDILPSKIYRRIITQLENGEYNADEESQLLAKLHSLEPTREWIAQMSNTERQMLKINLGSIVQECDLPIDVFQLSFIVELLGEFGLITESLIDRMDDSDNLYEQLNRTFYSQFFFIR